MQKKGKLELTWVGKYEEKVVEPRILVEDKSKSYGDPDTGNMLIHGDNLIALKALEQDFAGKIKCIYIDPPYNTGSAFEHYDDGLEHSEWLNMMKPRLEILRNLLSEDGSIWMSIDSYESHYLKVMSDEIFGRRNFIDEVIWQRAYAPINLKKTLSKSHDTILIYAKNNNQKFEFNKLPRDEEANSRYKNPDNDYRGVWKSSDCSVGPAIKEKIYEIKLPSGRKVYPPKGRCWLFTKERFKEMNEDNRIWYGPKGDSVPSVKKFLTEVRDGIVAQTLWTYKEVGHNQDAKKEVKVLFMEDPFVTPKPERLIERILRLASNEGDIVLDSFLGSGTTAAVAHKMGRRWIGIELGDHAYTHCKVRMDKVVDGEQGGISKAVGWKGGGGYKFYELAPSLLEKHQELPIYTVNKFYTFEMLCEAICKLEGFRYHPEGEMHGNSSETRFIHIAKDYVSADYVMNLLKNMGEKDSVLIYGTKIQSRMRLPDSVVVKKIPKDLLDKCVFESEVR